MEILILDKSGGLASFAAGHGSGATALGPVIIVFIDEVNVLAAGASYLIFAAEFEGVAVALETGLDLIAEAAVHVYLFIHDQRAVSGLIGIKYVSDPDIVLQ